jgi:uncharacterized repeat protein (TIGR01451 family)
MKSLRALNSSQFPRTSVARNTLSATSLRRARLSLLALVALVGLAFYSGSHAAPFFHYGGKSVPASAKDAKSRSKSARKDAAHGKDTFNKRLAGLLPAADSSLLPALVETIDIFAADCTTPKTNFILGDTVCAKTNGVTESDRFVNWCVACPTIDYGGAGVTPIDPNNQPQNFLYTPTAVGLWKATIADPSDSSILPATFTVTAQAEAIATYAGDCTTPKTTFNLGDVVCARAVGFDPSFNRRFAWQDPAGFVRDYTPIMNNPQTDSFTLPGTETSVIDVFTVDNRGQWKVNVVSSRGTTLASAPFNVQGASPRADLSVGKGIIGDAPDSGTNFKYAISITNFGPNAAANVALSDAEPDNATFVSITQTSGPTFGCTGSDPVVCTRVAGLAVGESASFEVTYTAGAAGTTVTNIASVSSTTTELNNADNTATSGRVTIGGTPTNPPTCSLDCPNDITTARTEAGGTHVTFASPETVGTCGTLNYDHVSGSLFAVGTTTVHVSSSTGDGACTFNVTVIDSPNPTISCPANQTVAAPSGQSEVSVSVGTPTASANTTITSERSDERPVNDQYPIGTTYITWTATDQFDRSANCTQTIIVTSTDAPTITCPSNKTFTAASGECTYTANSGQIGSPTTTGPNVTVTSERSDGEALTAPYPAGQTYITWTATNNVGTASCTETITVNATDNQAPTLHVPANVSVTTDSCSALLDDELGVATAEDNCTASVNITRTGVPRVACPVPGDQGRTCESFVFPTGTTYVTYTATDAAGNTSTGVQQVTVTESPAIPPTITAPADATYQCASEVPAASPSQATASDNCGAPTVTVSETNNGGAGTTASPLVITRTYTATDASNNTASATQTITVIDNTAPVVTAPGPVTLYTGPNASSCGVTVSDLDGTFGTGSATDNCSGVGAVTRSGVPSGNVFPVGNTTLTYSATDAHGNTGTATQIVTVIDNTPPVVTAPANVTAYTGPGATSCGTVVSDATLGTATANDNCPGIGSITRTGVPSGNAFPVGNTTITYSVTDAHGNSSSATQTVTVIDNTLPQISCPANITIEPTCPSGAIATYTAPVGTDNCPNPVTTRTAGLASGSVFPIGTTTVTHSVTDANGNGPVSCNFTVTVLTPQAVVQNLINSVNASSLTGPQKNGLISKLNAALTAINGGGGNACAKLSDFVNSVGTLISHGDISAATGNAWISSANHVRNTIGCTNLGCS